MRFLNFLAKRSKTFIIIFSLTLILLVGMANYVSGFEVSTSFFFLLPVGIVAWFSGKKSAIIISFISAFVWQYSNYLSGQTFSNQLIPIWNASTRLGFFLVVVFLLVELKKSLRHEIQLARTDHLTGAENPRSFYEKAQREMERSRRFGRSISLAYLDADNFKLVNDTFGHKVGSELLVKVVQTLKSNLRTTDIVARMGGDEFLILLPETNQDQAKIAVSKIRKRLGDTMNSENWPVTFSIGVLTCTEMPESVDELIKVADDLMYSVKRKGKNSVCYEVFEGLNTGVKGLATMGFDVNG